MVTKQDPGAPKGGTAGSDTQRCVFFKSRPEAATQNYNVWNGGRFLLLTHEHHGLEGKTKVQSILRVPSSCR